MALAHVQNWKKSHCCTLLYYYILCNGREKIVVRVTKIIHNHCYWKRFGGGEEWLIPENRIGMHYISWCVVDVSGGLRDNVWGEEWGG